MHAMTDRIKAENLTAWSSYQDFQVPSMEEQMSEVSTPPAFSPISSVDTQALEIYESPTPQQMQYQQSYPLQIAYPMTPARDLYDPPEFTILSRAAASVMQHTNTESTGIVLFVEKNKHTTVEISHDCIQAGDVLLFSFWYGNTPLQTRHEKLISCSCSEQSGFVTINGKEGHQVYGGVNEEFVLNNYLMGSKMELKLSFKHNTACFKPLIVDRMHNRGVSPIITMDVQVLDGNKNPKTKKQTIHLKVGSNVKREFEKFVGYSTKPTRARSKRISGRRTALATCDANSFKSDCSKKLIFKKSKKGCSTLIIPASDTAMFEALAMRMGGEVIIEK